MNFVQPIREPELVQDIANYFRKQNERNYIMFLLGIYTGLRITDILNLRVRDVKNRNTIVIREKKTRKQRTTEINPVLKKALSSYIEGKDYNEYLIKSRRGRNKPISRSMAYKIMRQVADEFGLEGIGTHTLRKTFGYHFYKQTKDVVTLQKIFNHSHPEVTLRYIGIEQENINTAIRRFRIY
ncbi:MAG TPA: site-specific integrase [Bacillota bacterium]|nr:site-specific integrase [Bacillota bacterium]